MFLITGATLMFMFSFKPYEEVKEHAMLRISGLGNKGVTIYYENNVQHYSVKAAEYPNSEYFEGSVSKYTNQMLKEGWELISTDDYPNGGYYRIHFVRTKR